MLLIIENKITVPNNHYYIKLILSYKYHLIKTSSQVFYKYSEVMDKNVFKLFFIKNSNNYLPYWLLL